MATNDFDRLEGNFKRVYNGKLQVAVPADYKAVFDAVPFATGERDGEDFREAIRVAAEQGFAGAPIDTRVTLPTPIPGKTIQAKIRGYKFYQTASIGFETMANAMGAPNQQAFADTTKDVMQSLTDTMRFHQARVSWYGNTNLGVVATTANSATIAITPGTFADGLWYGRVGMKIDVFSADLATKRSGSGAHVVNLNESLSAPTITVSAAINCTEDDVIVFSGSVDEDNNVHNETPGVEIIAGTRGGTLFGVDQDDWHLFEAATFAVDGVFTKNALTSAALRLRARAPSQGMRLFCNPYTGQKLMDELTLRFNDSNASGSVKVGFNKYKLETTAGLVDMITHPMFKRGKAHLVAESANLRRIGAYDFKLGGPYGEGAIRRAVGGDDTYEVLASAIQAPFTSMPNRIIELTGITLS